MGTTGAASSEPAQTSTWQNSLSSGAGTSSIHPIPTNTGSGSIVSCTGPWGDSGSTPTGTGGGAKPEIKETLIGTCLSASDIEAGEAVPFTLLAKSATGSGALDVPDMEIRDEAEYEKLRETLGNKALPKWSELEHPYVLFLNADLGIGGCSLSVDPPRLFKHQSKLHLD